MHKTINSWETSLLQLQIKFIDRLALELQYVKAHKQTNNTPRRYTPLKNPLSLNLDSAA